MLVFGIIRILKTVVLYVFSKNISNCFQNIAILKVRLIILNKNTLFYDLFEHYGFEKG